MTCVVGMVYDGKVWMGCDSLAATESGHRGFISDVPKMFFSGGFGYAEPRNCYLIGYTSSFRMGEILMFNTTFPAPDSHMLDNNPLRFMVTEFIPAVRTAMKDNGYARVDNNVETVGDFLVAIRNNLFLIEADLQVSIPKDGIVAVGTGAPEAIGALYALRRVGIKDPNLMINIALRAAQEYTPTVREPFMVACTEQRG